MKQFRQDMSVPAKKQEEPKKQEEVKKPWTADEISLLSQAVARYPGGRLRFFFFLKMIFFLTDMKEFYLNVF